MPLSVDVDEEGSSPPHDAKGGGACEEEDEDGLDDMFSNQSTDMRLLGMSWGFFCLQIHVNRNFISIQLAPMVARAELGTGVQTEPEAFG